MAADKMNIRFRIKAVDDFSKNMQKLDRQLNKVKRSFEQLPENTSIEINVSEQKALRDIEKVEDELDELERRSVWIPIKVAYQEWRNQMGRMATTIRNVGELVRHEMISAFVALSPVAASSIGVIAGGLGALGPIIGTTAGGIMGLGTAFGLAGAGAVGFGAVASSVLGKVFDTSEDMAKLQEKLNDTKDEEERAKILEEMELAMSKLSDEQVRAYDSLQTLKSTWGDISKSMEPGVVDAFTKAIEALKTSLKLLKPTFEGATDAVNNLLTTLNVNLAQSDVRELFEWMGESAGPALETLGKAFGNFGVGLGNMMKAFSPLSVEMQNGLLGMSESFREWSNSLEESEKFQNFINYVRENGPKLLDIFGSLVLGLTDMFAAFGPLSSEMLTGLQNMINKFQEWASTLSENPQFQEFIDYVRSNGPEFISLLGNIRDFLINLGIGFAEVGEKIMPLINNFLEWANSLMENNRHIAEMIGWAAAVGGALSALYPIVAFLYRIFTSLHGIFKVVGGFINRTLLPMFTKFHLFVQTKVNPILQKLTNFLKTKVGPAFTFLWGKIKNVIPWVVRIGGKLKWLVAGPIGLVIGIVVELGILIVKNWDKIKDWTMKTFNKIGGFFSKKWKDIETTFKTVTNALKGIVSKKFNDMKNAVSEKLNKAYNSVKNIFGNITGFLDNINLFDSGKKIIGSAVDGIKSMGKKVKDAVSNIAGKIRNFFPFSPAKEGPLSTLDKLDFAGPVTDSIKRGKGVINRAMNGLLNVPTVNVDSGENVRARRGYESQGHYSHSNRGNVQSPATITQNLHFHGDAARTPSETARKNKQVLRDLALEVNF